MNKPKKLGLADLKRLTQQGSQAQPAQLQPASKPQQPSKQALKAKQARYHPADPRRPGGAAQGLSAVPKGAARRPGEQSGLSRQALQALAQAGAEVQGGRAKKRPVTGGAGPATAGGQPQAGHTGLRGRRGKAAAGAQPRQEQAKGVSGARRSKGDRGDAGSPGAGVASVSSGAAQVEVPANLQGPEASVASALSAADRALFRRVMQAVQPLKQFSPRVTLSPKVLSAWEAEQRRLAAVGAPPTPLAQVSDVYTASAISEDGKQYVQSGHGLGVLKDLQKNRWPIEAWLDLHGSTLDEARPRLEQFLQLAMQAGVRCVSVVHGKGHGSANGQPVLKEAVRRWLGQFASVVAYIECSEAEGGAGAVKVLLKKGE